jgi:hypothetical protein
MVDFFISYTSADTAWAEWIGFVLEEEGFTATIQAWDFRPGNNFVLEMQRAASKADRTIMVLSPDYLTSQFASSEWASALEQDPQGLNRKLVPIVVRECQPMGLLKPIVHINLLNMDESAARQRLTQGLSAERAKPSQRPAFPGARKSIAHKAYPGLQSSSTRQSITAPYIPTIKPKPSDIEKRQFIKQFFELMASRFREWLTELSERHEVIQTDFEQYSTTEFTAEIFIQGKSVCRCRLRRGGLHTQDEISYAEGSTSAMSNASNEIIGLAVFDGELHLTAQLAIAYRQSATTINTGRMTHEEAAQYLWGRFVAPLER